MFDRLGADLARSVALLARRHRLHSGRGLRRHRDGRRVLNSAARRDHRGQYRTAFLVQHVQARRRARDESRG